MSVPKCFIFQDLERLTEVFGGMSAGISGRKLPLWADFSFLKWLGVWNYIFRALKFENSELGHLWPSTGVKKASP